MNEKKFAVSNLRKENGTLDNFSNKVEGHVNNMSIDEAKENFLTMYESKSIGKKDFLTKSIKFKSKDLIKEIKDISLVKTTLKPKGLKPTTVEVKPVITEELKQEFLKDKKETYKPVKQLVDRIETKIKRRRIPEEKVIPERDEYLNIVMNDDGTYKSKNDKINQEQAKQLTNIYDITFRAGTTIKTVNQKLNKANKL